MVVWNSHEVNIHSDLYLEIVLISLNDLFSALIYSQSPPGFFL